MKKIIINTIIISLLSITSIFADNNNVTKNSNDTKIEASVSTALVTITDMNGKIVYNKTFTVDAENDFNLTLNPENKLNKGVYIVIVDLNGEKITHKLIVQ